MSLRMGTNLDAMQSLFNLNNISSQISLSIQRLSSGLRINSAADDPAGYIISNSLQTQLDGVNQAVANNQTSSNLVKTAESGIGQVNSLLSSIRQKALEAANTTDPTVAQADQTAINSALQSINSIAGNTQFGNKKLLDGSAGVAAAVTNTSLVGGVQIGGTYGGGVTQAGSVSITVNNAATEAQVAGTATYASVNASISTVNGGTTGTGGSVVINGQSVTVAGSDTVQTLINKINALTGTTGVSAGAVSGNGSTTISLTQGNYGANYKINESESSPLLLGASSTAVSGLNATVTVVASTLVGGAVSSVVATFVGGRYSSDSGLRATDAGGNSILLTGAGNNTSTSNATVATVTNNALQFQTGGNVGQTATVSLNSITTNNLGTTSVPGQNLSTIDVTSAAGANNAIKIVDEARTQINQYAANLGSFRSNVLDTTTNFLSNTAINLSASISSIRDVNVAEEVTKLTQNQIIQQAGFSVLATSNNQSSYLLKLLG